MTQPVPPSSSLECPICLGGSTADNPLQAVDHKTDCKRQHFFHASCLLPQVEAERARGRTPECPFDKIPITGIGRAPFPAAAQPIAVPQQPPLILAARNNNLADVQALLANGDDDYRGEAVKAAAKNGHLLIVQALLANGVIHDGFRGEAVALAAENGNLPIVQALLANGGINDGNRGWAVEVAAKNGHLLIVQALLANGVIHDGFHRRAVEKATANGHHEIVEALRKKRSYVKLFAATTVTIALVSWFADFYFSNKT